MAAATPQFGALTLAVTKAASLAAGNVVVGVLDEFNRGRLYMPFTWGYTPQTGDAANKWLPQVGTVTPITNTDGVNGNQVGQYLVTLIPGTADQVNVASVQTMRVDGNALFITATSTW
jgi:hypothetical protein